MTGSRVEVDPSFFWRKLHSLSGIVPVGAFLAEHFWSNSYVLVSEAKYNEVGQGLQTIPFRIVIEAVAIWIPILFHGGYGLYVWWRGKSNAWQYPWMANWMYSLQRVSGIGAFLFIGWHFYSARILTQGRSNFSTVHSDMLNNWYALFYVAGILLTSFHLGNGIWNFLCKWGLAATERAQRVAGYLGAAVAISFSLAGLAIVAGARYAWHPFQFYIQ